MKDGLEVAAVVGVVLLGWVGCGCMESLRKVRVPYFGACRSFSIFCVIAIAISCGCGCGQMGWGHRADLLEYDKVYEN